MVIIKENEVKNFKFEIELKGSEMKKASARIIFESKAGIKMFPVFISETGECKAKVSHNDVKSLRDGSVYLEVLAENMCFRPWQDKYTIKNTVIAEKAEKTVQAPKRSLQEVMKPTQSKPKVKQAPQPVKKSSGVSKQAILEALQLIGKSIKTKRVVETVTPKKPVDSLSKKILAKNKTIMNEHQSLISEFRSLMSK